MHEHAQELLAACDEFAKWNDVVSTDNYYSDWTITVVGIIRAAIARARPSATKKCGAVIP